jgi:HSP20 family molecular chaperone IbpA
MIDKNTGKEQPADAGDDVFTTPPVDVVEDSSGITLYADLPGVPKDKLRIRVESDTLFIDGDVSLPWVKDLQATHVEVPYPKYRRTFTLGKELDRDKVAAEFRQGVLRLHIPKVEHVKPRKIEVQVA